MRIAIIGAGFTGLSAGYYLSKASHEVTIIEHTDYIGGLAAGFRKQVDDYPNDWNWDLDRYYHHWFTNDKAIFDLAKDINLQQHIKTLKPITASYINGQSYQIDSPQALFSFPLLSLQEKIRMAVMLAIFKVIPNGSFLERWTAHNGVKTLVGESAYKLFWEPLLQGKFDKYYKEVNLAWLWARIYKRTPKLAYYEGGFQAFADALLDTFKQKGGTLLLSSTIETIKNIDDAWHISAGGGKMIFDAIICTTPPATFIKLFPDLPEEYRNNYTQKLDGIGAHAIAMALDEKFFSNDTYWLSIHETSWPFLIVAEHTNFVDPKHYGGKHILYVGDYLDPQDPKMKMNKDELLNLFEPYLQQLNPKFKCETIKRSWLWRSPYAQPIVPINHSKHIPPMQTPLQNVYLASMSQVYPWDRGTNYAVQMGKKVANYINNV